VDIQQTIRMHQQALLGDLIALLQSQSDAKRSGYEDLFGDLYEGIDEEGERTLASSRRAHFAIRAQRLMLPTLAAAYHKEREPLALKIEAHIGPGEQYASLRYIWVAPDGEIAYNSGDAPFEKQDEFHALQWAWDQGYRRADEEVWTLDLPATLPAVDANKWLTPAEAAALTGTSESSWRNRCAAGQVEGAFKKGKQWIIPHASVEA
jgi:hypothetical protein